VAGSVGMIFECGGDHGSVGEWCGDY